MFADLLFILSALAVLIGAIMVVTEKNLMHACLFLLLSLFGVAGLYVTLNAQFLAGVQLLVYAGGVVILMLFAVMLTGGIEAPENKLGIEKIPGMGNIKTYFIAGLCGIVVSSVVLKLIFDIMNSNSTIEAKDYTPAVDKIGKSLITDHVLAFEISSVLLLGALIGAAIIARPRVLNDD